MIDKIVTSFSPHRVERQRDCLASWQRFGLPIVGVQTKGEIDHISTLFPGVEFVSVPTTANAWDRPHLPRITDMVKQATDGAILLLNADITINDSPEQFHDEWMRDDKDSLVVGVRYDHNGTQSVLNPYGIDAFRITPEMAGCLSDIGFAIGVPGWDYWLPWELYSHGFGIRVADSSLYHEVHDMGYAREAIAIAQTMLSSYYGLHRREFTSFAQRITGRPVTNGKRKAVRL